MHHPQKNIFAILIILLGASTSGAYAKYEPPPVSLMNPMEHGPFVSSTIASDPLSTRSIITHKGIAVKVGPEDEGTIVFDTDLLRMATAWTGGFLHWNAERDGLEKFPRPDGFTHFSTSQRPGWSLNGQFKDPRAWSYGPVPKAIGRYHGLYLHNKQLVFSYSVGNTKVLESPGFHSVDDQAIFTRTFNIAASEETLSLLVLQTSDGKASTLKNTVLSPTHGVITLQSGKQARQLAYQGLGYEAWWRLQDGHLVLDLPKSNTQAQHFSISIGPVLKAKEHRYMRKHMKKSKTVPDLAPLTKPGPGRWQTLETEIIQGADEGPFALDTLSIPMDNPWNAYLRFTAVDFLSEGRAVLASISGDVWLVDGLAKGAKTLKWKRYATGLNQALGVKVVNDKIYITGRDQITVLHDYNGDDEADYYENFNNEVMASVNFHAFTLNLDTDSKGNFYFAKATPWPPVSRLGKKAEITPHHGVLFQLPPDGSKLEVIATGLRNPNGLSIGPNDEILYSDNEGNWVPTSKVHRIQKGGFHGFMPSAHQSPPPNDFVKPMMWVPHFVDNSPSTPIFIASKTWPAALQNQVLLTSYGRGNLSLVLREEIDGQWQAAHLNLPLIFNSGTLHGRFNAEGDLFIVGLKSWQSFGHGGQWGTFQRVRYTGQPLHLPVAVNTIRGGLELHFSEALDAESASEVSNYSIQQWTYPWTSQYGTRGKIYSIDQPGETHADPVTITAIKLAEDRKSVTLDIPTLQQSLVQKSLGIIPGLPDMKDRPLGIVMAIDYRLTSADGKGMAHRIHKTIHRVSDKKVLGSSPRQAHQKMRKPLAPAEKLPPKTQKDVATDVRVIALKTTGIELAYDKTEILAKPGERLLLRFINASDMAHNIVVVRSEADIEPVGIAAMRAQQDEFVPQGEMHRILAASRLAYPGETVDVAITAPEAGTYPYICTFSGHFTMMQGRLIVRP